MKLVVQRVKKASVSVDGRIIGKIGMGLFVLVGVQEGDDLEDANVLADKLSKLRIMKDDNGKMNLSVMDIKAEVLAVSQFTLSADTSKGNRPSFLKAAEPQLAEKIYNQFINRLKENGVKVKTGKFGNYMLIDAVMDGPVTIIM